MNVSLPLPARACGGVTTALTGRPSCAYALLPHAGRWDKAGVPAVSATWQEPALGAASRDGGRRRRSLIEPHGPGWAVPAMFERGDALYVRLFNAGGDDTPRDLGIGFVAGKIELVELDGRVIEELKALVDEKGRRTFRLSVLRSGIRTLRFREVKVLRPE